MASIPTYADAFHITVGGLSLTAQDTIRLLPILTYLDRHYYDVGIEIANVNENYKGAYGIVRRVLLVEYVCQELSRRNETQWSGRLSADSGQELRTTSSLVITSTDVMAWAGQNYKTYLGRKQKVRKLRVAYDYLVTHLNSVPMNNQQREMEEKQKKRLALFFSPRLIGSLSRAHDPLVVEVLGALSSTLMALGQQYDNIPAVKAALGLQEEITLVDGELEVAIHSRI